MPTSTLTSKGQTVIPKAIRDYLGLKPGDSLDFVVLDEGEVLIRPLAHDVRTLRGVLRRPGRKPVTVEEMKRTIKERKRNLP